ncbi:hypothetical protein PFISCL1PPCAC_21301, partial [Pristionchus fissidentatus]
GAVHLYPAAAATIMVANAALAAVHSGKNVANFAHMSCVPTYMSMYGMLPATYRLGAAPSPFFDAVATSGATGAPLCQFDVDAQALQQQMVNHCSQAAPGAVIVSAFGVFQELFIDCRFTMQFQKQALLYSTPHLTSQ